MIWLKEKWNKFKKWLIGLGIISVALAAGIEMLPIDEAILEKSIDGIILNINYTDENNGEGLIIRTEKSEYLNLGTVGVYFSIHNNTREDQNVDIVFSFFRDYQLRIWEYAGEKTISVPDFHPAVFASSTGAVLKEAYTEYKNFTLTEWNEIASRDFTIKNLQRKDIKNTKSLKENSAFIKSGETKFFKANIKYASRGREEFFIEAFGENHYGMLDPWVFEDKFNSDTKSLGDLNGQDSWVADTDGDVINTAFYEGDQGIVHNGLGWLDPYAYYDVSAVTSGTLYAAVRNDSTAASNQSLIILKSAAGVESVLGGLISIADGGGDIYYTPRGGGSVDIGNYVAGQWYVFKITFDQDADTNRFEVYDVTAQSWIADSGTVNNGTAAGDITRFNWTAVLATGQNGKAFFDYISPTDPTVSAGAAIDSSYIILFE